ncbi:MAG: hypothetical protein JXA67_10835, partial [Micromonosporaceae bacterium]|nr:hypothetical protein [Micromonosporaceae bacterium]
MARQRRLGQLRHPLRTLPWLAGAIALTAFSAPRAPQAGLDPSCTAGINIASSARLRFGPKILMTFGPWGFLDTPMITDWSRFFAGVLFSVAAVTALFVAIYSCLRRVLIPPVAAPATFALISAVSLSVNAGLWWCCASAIFALSALAVRHGPRMRGWIDAWPGAALAGFGTLMLQVKFSDGLVILALGGVVTIAASSPRSLVRNLVVAVPLLVLTFALAWLLAGQSLRDIPVWLLGSWEITLGYSQAMADRPPDYYLRYALAAVLTLVAVALAVQASRGRDRAARIGIALVVVVTLEFGLKHGFTRDDAGHEVSFFLLAGGVLLWLASRLRRPALAFTAAALALVQIPHGFQQFDLHRTRAQWSTSVQALLDQDYGTRLQAQARAEARGHYQLPPSMINAARGHPVSVDPWEAALPWAYSLDWNPTPVFQSYAAYTPALDRINAEAIITAPQDQIVLRHRTQAIDERNPAWETPRYLLALACNYHPTLSDPTWTMLIHTHGRCSNPRTIETRVISARQTVPTPPVGPDHVLITRFTPAPA